MAPPGLRTHYPNVANRSEDTAQPQVEVREVFVIPQPHFHARTGSLGSMHTPQAFGSGGHIAVVVAFNRRDLLAQTLDGIAAQTVRPDSVIVIDNASTDDSAEVAENHPSAPVVVRMPENFGGAGGFAAGLASAVADHGAETVWIMDDDTIPEPQALEELLRARRGYPGQVALCASRAVWHDGREHPMNTPRARFGVSRRLKRHASLVNARQIRTASFVSILIDARAVREAGLPVADYFLWNDDFEYTARLLKRRVGLYVPASRVLHATAAFGGSTFDPGPRFYNEVRNKLWVFGRSPALGPIEKALYGVRTAVRWGKLFANSDASGEAELTELAEQAVRDAQEPPRTNREIFAGTPVERAVAVLE